MPKTQPHASPGASGGPSRRAVLTGLGAMAAAGLPLATWPAAADVAADLAAARKEGTLVVWHSDQEADVVNFLKVFTERTGIPAVQQRILPGVAMPKLQAEMRAGSTDVDIYMNADPGLMDLLREKNQLLRYETPELAAYAPEFLSQPPGYWTTYCVNLGALMYDTRTVSPADAPKTWMDLLDPRWKDQIGFQNAAAGTQYGWWYVLRSVLPPSFWTGLAAQKPRAYASSTQILSSLQNGSLKIGGKVSAYQYVKAAREKQSIAVVYPSEGTPATNHVAGIIAATKRPNAAKVFIDFLLSKDGQYVFNDIQGSPSARKDVVIPGVASISDIKVLVPTNFEDFKSNARHAEFVALWNKITGF
ncbi:extracellular solute-binding protein [Xanthobacter dioxanivorans]|uniref:Extracellular solute-binding protein n=1 Tax=Xanthobacter dioxanivorans TaxID=2528964 RepID=A0A974SKR9_9HYPH|nr:extracellular solute-binding protein [Xanthobacter dioxanivorans]QRG09130.1 extracellular solute-binding protein [Xanthobacter dioxanivorans]